MKRTNRVPEISVFQLRLFQIRNIHATRCSLLAEDLGGDAVEIAAALRGQPAASVRVLLDHLELLHGLEGLAGDRTGAGDPVAGVGTIVSATSVDLANCGDSDRGPDVDVSGEGGAPGVVPVLI